MTLRMFLKTEVGLGCGPLVIVMVLALLLLTSRNKLSSAFPDEEVELTNQCPASGFLVSDTADLGSWLL